MTRIACAVATIEFCLVASACHASGDAGSQSKPRDVAWFLKRMVDIEWLAYHEPGVRCKQFSSYDRRSKIVDGKKIDWDANGDAGNYLRENDSEGRVMAEMDGPGCITQIWSANPAGTIRIWLDGEAEPSIEMPMAELLSNQGKAPFKEPFCYQVRPVGSNHTASNCYLPIPYAKSCKIAQVDGRSYYNVNYIIYPKDTPVVTFKLPLTGEQQKALAETAAQLGKNQPVLPKDMLQQKFAGRVGPSSTGAELVNVTRDGGGIVRQLSIKTEGADKYALRKAVLKIYYDGCKEPAVVAPLVDFFGTGWMPTPYTSTASSIGKDGTMTSYWPMPFKKSVRLTLANHGNETLKLSGLIKTSAPRTGCKCEPMYFHAMYRREKLSTTFDYPFCQGVAGPGRLVGNLLNIDNPFPGWWGEGDEKVWVDGEPFPSWWGTGSEDYYNDAWGMHLHDRFQEGCPLLEGPGHANKTSMYRWHVLDSIPFEKSLTMTIENYWKTGRGVRCDYSSVCYYYNMQPAGDDFYKPLTLTDLLPCNFRPEGTVEAETMDILHGRKLSMEQLADMDLADVASGSGAVELKVAPMFSSQVQPPRIPLGELKPGLYQVHLYLLAKDETPGIAALGFGAIAGEVKPKPGSQEVTTKITGVMYTIDDQDKARAKLAEAGDKVLCELRPAKLPATIAKGSSCQTVGLVFVQGEHPFPVSVPIVSTDGKARTIYLDAVRLETPKTHGIEAESIKWTSPDHLVTVKKDIGNTALSGWGQVTMETLSIGGLAAIPVDLKPGYYEVRGRLGCGPDFGQFRVRVELVDKRLRTYDGYAPEPGLREHGFGRFEVAKERPLKQLTFMICGKNARSSDTKMAVDYLEIIPCKGLTGYEAEDMPVLGIHAGAAQSQNLGPAFSRNHQKFITFGSKDGWIKLGFDVPKPGTYEVVMAFCKSFDYATIQAYLDGKPIGEPLDTYSPHIVHTGPIQFGRHDLKTGRHVLEFRVVGKNPKSAGVYMGLDYLELVPAKE